MFERITACGLRLAACAKALTRSVSVRRRPRTIACLFAAIVGLVMASAQPVVACSVCFGAQDDPMVQGTAKGVLLMIGVTYAVLLGMGGLMVTWFVRGRRRMPPTDRP